MGAALILVVLTVVTFVYLPDIENPPASRPRGCAPRRRRFASIDQPDPAESGGPVLRIEVNGQQYLWRYDYAGRRPALLLLRDGRAGDTTVVLEVTASDVIHSWWIPKLGGKVDGVPGHVNETWFKIPGDKAIGHRLRGQCAELCGANHADMRAEVRAVSPRPVRGVGRARTRRHRAAGEELAEQRERRRGGEPEQ